MSGLPLNGRLLLPKFDMQSLVDQIAAQVNLVKEKGMTLKGAKKKMKENKEDTEHNFEIIKSLESIKDMLIEVRESL